MQTAADFEHGSRDPRIAICGLVLLFGIPAMAKPRAPGLPWVLFHATDLQRPAEFGLDERVDLTLAGYSDYSRLWLGRIRFPVGGEITPGLEARQGVRLFVGARWSSTAGRPPGRAAAP